MQDTLLEINDYVGTQHPYSADITPVLQRRKIRLGKVKKAAEDHRLLKEQAGSRPRSFCLWSSQAFTLN